MLFLHEQENAKITENRLDLEQSIYKDFLIFTLSSVNYGALH